jgi:HEAT repeat protein
MFFPIMITCVFISWGMQQNVFAQSVDSLIQLAESAYHRGNYMESARLWNLAISVRSQDPILWYNSACSLALLDQKEEAYSRLEESVEHGFDMDDHMEQDPDLVSLHPDKRWANILERVKQKEAIRIHYESLLDDITDIDGLTENYRNTPSKNGVRRTYEGFKLPDLLVRESEGIISINAVSKDSLNFTIKSKEGHGTISFSVYPIWGKGLQIWQTTGDFATLSPYLDNVERKRHQKYFDRVAAFRHQVELYRDSTDHYDLSLLLQRIPGVIDTLNEYVHSQSDYAQQTAIEIAGSVWPLNDQLLDILIAAKNIYNTGFRSMAIDALERVGLSNHKALPALIEFAELDRNSGARGAIERLCRTVKDSIPMLLLVVKYTNYGADMAIRQLDTMNYSDPRIIRGLIEALHDGSALARECAARALGHRTIMLDEILPALAAALADSEMIGRYAAGESLSKFGQRGVSILIQSLKNDDIYTRTSAIEALEKIKPVTDEMEDAFIRSLNDSNSDVRATASSVLERLKTPKSRKALDVFKEDEKLRQQQAEQEYQAEQSRTFSLAEICLPVPSNADYKEPLTIQYSVPVVIKNDTVFFLTVHTDRDRPDQLNIWKKVKGGFRHINTLESDGGEYHGYIDEPIVFHMSGETFIYIQNYSGGNGGYHDDSVYVVTDLGDLQPVDFVAPTNECDSLLREGETIMNGVSNDIADDTLSFSFGIWEKDDAHCCPSGGMIDGTYKLEKTKTYDPISRKEKMSYRITVGDFERLPPKGDR